MYKSSIIKNQNPNTVNNNTNNKDKIVNKLKNPSSVRESTQSNFKNKVNITSNKLAMYPTKKVNFKQNNNESFIEKKPKDLKIYEKLKFTNRKYYYKQTDKSMSKDLDTSKLTEKNLKINKTQVREYNRKYNNLANNYTNNINSLNVTKENITTRTRNIRNFKINHRESNNKTKSIGKDKKINQEPHLTVATKNIIKIIPKSHHPTKETSEDKILIKKSSNLNRLKNQVNTSLEKPPPKKDYKFISNMFSNPENNKDKKDIMELARHKSVNLRKKSYDLTKSNILSKSIAVTSNTKAKTNYDLNKSSINTNKKNVVNLNQSHNQEELKKNATNFAKSNNRTFNKKSIGTTNDMKTNTINTNHKLQINTNLKTQLNTNLATNKINLNNKTLQAKNSVKSMYSQKPVPKNSEKQENRVQYIHTIQNKPKPVNFNRLKPLKHVKTKSSIQKKEIKHSHDQINVSNLNLSGINKNNSNVKLKKNYSEINKFSVSKNENNLLFFRNSFQQYNNSLSNRTINKFSQQYLNMKQLEDQMNKLCDSSLDSFSLIHEKSELNSMTASHNKMSSVGNKSDPNRTNRNISQDEFDNLAFSDGQIEKEKNDDDLNNSNYNYFDAHEEILDDYMAYNAEEQPEVHAEDQDQEQEQEQDDSGILTVDQVKDIIVYFNFDDVDVEDESLFYIGDYRDFQIDTKRNYLDFFFNKKIQTDDVFNISPSTKDSISFMNRNFLLSTK